MRFLFGDCVLDDSSRELTVAGEVRHLAPKGFELLLCLVRERPRAVSKRELHERLWPDTFVSDVSLAKIVSEVRREIGRSIDGHERIRTVHRFGYAFAGEATEDRTHVRGAGVHERAGVVHWLSWPDRTARLLEGENVVGRDPDSTVWLDSPRVSRRHARIVVNGGLATLEDLGSRNGTWLGEAQLSEPSRLNSGDRIQIGPFALVYRANDAAAPTEDNT